MKHSRPLLAVLVLVLALVGGLALLLSKPGADEAPRALDLHRTETAESNPGADLVQGSTERLRSAAASSLATEVSALDENFALEGTRLLRGRVRPAPGAPADASLCVLAVELDGPPSPTGDLSFAQSRLCDGARFARREVDASFRFELPIPADGKFEVFVDGRYLHLAETVVVRASELDGLDLVLEPVLGALVTVRLVPPAGVTPAELDGARVQLVTLDARRRREPDGGLVQREGVSIEDRLEFRGLSAHSRMGLRARHPAFTVADAFESSLVAGERYDVELELSHGAVVEGRVIDERGAPVPGARVTVERPDGAFGSRGGHLLGLESYLIATEKSPRVSDARGGFTVQSLAPGSITLTARHESFLASEAERTKVAAREVRALELVLRDGASLTGVVLLPDGSPAKDAMVLAAASDNERDDRWFDRRVRRDTTDVDGRFRLRGLHEKPYDVRAEWSQGRALPFKRVEFDVPSSTSDFELKLLAPLTLEGRVVDDLGQPIERFAVTAVPTSEPWDGRRELVSVAIESSELGAFELAGVYPGTYEVSGSSHEHLELDGASVTLSLPSELAPVELRLSRGGTVSGLVLDAAGKPIEGAALIVELVQERRPMWGLDCRTDARGAFRCTGIPPGAHEIRAEHPEHATSAPLPFESVTGIETADLRITMRAGGTLTGEVFGDDGHPQPGRNVSLMSNDGSDGNATSDASGRFEIRNLIPGTYQVVAEPPAEKLAELEDANDMTAMIALLDMASVEIRDGETAHVVLGAPARAPVRVFGTVYENGEPLAGGSVMAVPESGEMLSGFKPGKIAEDGTYEVTLDEPGDYVFMVGVDLGRGAVEFYERIPETDAHALDLDLLVGGIAGRVLDAAGQPLDGYTVRLERQSSLPSLNDLSGGSSADSNATGEYHIRRVPPGVYTLRCDGGGGTYAAAVVTDVAVTDAGVTSGVDLVLRESCTLVGTVTHDGNPLPDAAVWVRDSAGNLLNRYSTTHANASGRFEIRGVPPGDVTVCARHAFSLVSEWVPVRATPEEPREVTIPVRPGTRLRVTLESEGSEAERASVSIRDEAGREHATTMSERELQGLVASGLSTRTQEFGPLPPGEYEVTATTHEGRHARKPVTLRESRAVRSVKLRLRE